jgi:ABC-type multidrug transport system ATPase subunit
VERLCDSVLMMKGGRIVDSGAPKELIAKYGRTTLEDVFLDVARHGALPGARHEGSARARRADRAVVLRHWYLIASSLAAFCRPLLLAHRADDPFGGSSRPS